MSERFKGTGVAIITPFHDSGNIDFGSFEKIIEHIISGGVNYIVALGTTGESVTLSRDEKVAVLEFVVEIVNKRIPVIAGLGGNNTQEIVNCVRNTDLKGIAAILSVSPYYNKPTQRGLFQHYKAIATWCPVPVILYNVPGRTASNITAETCLDLAHACDNIVAIKEASGDLSQIMKIIKDKPENFLVISGDDMLTIPVVAAGGSGVISVLANAFPVQCSELVSQALKNNFKSAREIQFRFLEIIELLFTEGNPSGVKEMLSLMNICHNNVRLPLVPVSRTMHTRIQKAMEEIAKG